MYIVDGWIALLAITASQSADVDASDGFEFDVSTAKIYFQSVNAKKGERV